MRIRPCESAATSWTRPYPCSGPLRSTARTKSSADLSGPLLDSSILIMSIVAGRGSRRQSMWQQVGDRAARGAVLRGHLQQPASQGVAVFSDLTLDRGGDGYTLVAWSLGLADATSEAFAYTAPPEPRDVLGYGCASGGAPALALLGLAALLLRRRRRGDLGRLALALAICATGAARAADA